VEALRLRVATPADLPAVYRVFHANEVDGAPSPPPVGPVPAILDHVRATGDLVVAELDGEIVGYAGAVVRGTVAYLTDLFVQPGRQSREVGRSLLRRVLPIDGPPRWTLSSADPRALALYARAGMRPLWPNLELRLEAAAVRDLPPTGVAATPADPDDPALHGWDAEISGRPRPADHTFWVRRQKATSLWFKRGGAVVGYGYVRTGISTVWTPEKTVVGPVGSRDSAAAAACVAAAVAWALPLGPVLDLAVPGPHPALAPLLEAGFRITYVETFCASAPDGAPDPRRYLGSGGDLF
jgi:GNAT superfamily N-acetyltransferase